MSLQALTQLLERAVTDEAFLAQLKVDFTAAVKGYDLTPDEIDALKSGDQARLGAVGVDERLSKGGNRWR